MLAGREADLVEQLVWHRQQFRLNAVGGSPVVVAPPSDPGKGGGPGWLPVVVIFQRETGISCPVPYRWIIVSDSSQAGPKALRSAFDRQCGSAIKLSEQVLILDPFSFAELKGMVFTNPRFGLPASRK